MDLQWVNLDWEGIVVPEVWDICVKYEDHIASG